MTQTAPIVYVVDDDPAVLRAVSRLLRSAGFMVIGFSSAQRFLDEHDPAAPSCLVLDLSMPGQNGLELQQALSAAGEPIPVIFLTGKGDVPASVRAMKQGAIDFLTKPVERAQLIEAVRTALERDNTTRRNRRELGQTHARLATLTPREYEVFHCVIRGMLNKQTAAELGTAEKTVKVHRARVMAKMSVVSVADLVRLAEHAGITLRSEAPDAVERRA